MRNANYHPDRAHLPSKEDKKHQRYSPKKKQLNLSKTAGFKGEFKEKSLGDIAGEAHRQMVAEGCPPALAAGLLLRGLMKNLND